MPKIPDYFAQTQAGAGVPSRRATGETFGAGVGRAIGQVGQVVGDVGDVIFEYEQRKEKLRQAENYSKVINELEGIANTQGQRLEDPNADIYNFRRVESDHFESTAGTLLNEADIQDPELTLRLQDRISNIRQRVDSGAFKAETIAIKARRDDTVQDNISTITQGVLAGTKDFDGALDDVDALLGNFRDSYNQVEFEQAKAGFKAQIAQTSIEAMAEVNPAGARNMLQSEKAAQVLSSEQMVKIDRTIDKQEAALQKQVIEAQKLEAQRSLVDATKQGQFLLDPTNKDHKAAVDADWNVVSQGLSQLPSDQFALEAINYVSEVGVLPTQLESGVIAMINNGSPENRAMAADIVQGIAREKPTALRQFTERERIMAQKISDNINAGLTPQQATEFADKAMMQRNTPEYQIRLSTYKDEQKPFKEGDFAEFFRDDPNVIPDGMKADYNTLFKRYYLDGGLEADSAKKLAIEKVKSAWKPSDVDGKNRWMKYSPEAMFDNGADPKWMKEQFRSDMLETGVVAEDLDNFLDSLIIEVAPETITEDAPHYMVFEKNEDGVLEPLLSANGEHIVWQPNYEESPQFKKNVELFEGDATKALDAAKFLRNQQEAEQNMMSVREGF